MKLNFTIVYMSFLVSVYCAMNQCRRGYCHIRIDDADEFEIGHNSKCERKHEHKCHRHSKHHHHHKESSSSDSDSVSKCHNDFISKRCYIDTIMSVLQKKCSSECELENYKYILLIIYNHFIGRYNELVLFTATALHNTSNFKCLNGTKDGYDDNYFPRGLLMIKGRNNYEMLDRLNESQFVLYPEKLANLDKISVQCTLNFWDWIIHSGKKINTGFKVTFSSVLQCLKPLEADPINLSDPVIRERLENRKEIYRVLCQMLNVTPHW
ncbi:Spore wall protein 25 [Astathelohania contejeani]|uniref:Spore wall protein 25 n=1 Tax=Astathelohania contejeani TaxID=164912 RepID=A0ABQ7HX07_9MICR|nr:Spore wall protein 25 [Thelohania contejeani]